MEKDKNSRDESSSLRNRAEAFINKTSSGVKKVPPQDVKNLVEELQIHQVELEMQNEELRRTQRELQESRDRFSDLYDLAPVGYFTIGYKGLIQEANLTGAAMLGVERGNLINQAFTHFITEGSQDIFYLDRQKLTETRSKQVSELRLKKKDGSEFHAQLECVVVEDDEDNIECFRAAVSDIDDRKQAEEERAKLEEQLKQSQKMESIGTLAGGIAHDFNNILGIILGNAELAMDDVQEWNPARQNLDEVKKACMRAKDVVRQILSFSRKSEIEQKSINIASLVAESLKLSRASIPTSIEIRQNIANDVDDILGDPTQIHQVMINFCTNAAHAMENDGGILEVTLENMKVDEDTASQYPELNPGPHVHLGVSDTGDGIKPEVIGRVFDPYFTTKEVGKGTGMGLAVVHGIVKSHHGSILVESKTGKGTTFKILFPAVEKKIPEKPKKLEELPAGQERILFVDDEGAMVNLNQKRLERLGYKVTGKTDPFEALEFFRSDPIQFDLVITDTTMPRMTGDRLAQEILKIRSDTPVIICTGYSNRISEARAQELGIRKYIEKPIEMENLARSVREVLDGK